MQLRKKVNKIKKFRFNFAENVYFMYSFHKLHILTTRGEKSDILTVFGPMTAILEHFPTEKEKKMHKIKKLRHVETIH